MFLSSIDTPARHIIISVKNEDSNNILFWFWQIFFSRQKYFWLRSEKYDRSASYQIKRMQFRTGVQQHLPAQLLEKLLGVLDSPKVEERRVDGCCVIIGIQGTGDISRWWGQNSTGRLNVAKRLESYNEILGNFHIEWRRSLLLLNAPNLHF